MTKRQIVVTGGAGFIGSHLVSALLNHECVITVLDNMTMASTDQIDPSVQLQTVDVTDNEAWQHLPSNVDTMFHLAGHVSIRASSDRPIHDLTTNTLGTIRALDAAIAAGARRFVFASSMAVYADAQGPVSEDATTLPVSNYGASKLAAEQYVRLYGQRHGIETMVLRLFNTYGAGQRLTQNVGVVTIFADAIKAGQPLTLYGGGVQQRDFIHVKDVAKAFIHAMEAPSAACGTYNIGTSVATSVHDLANKLMEIIGARVDLLNAPARLEELQYAVADVKAAKMGLGFEATRQLDATLQEMFR